MPVVQQMFFVLSLKMLNINVRHRWDKQDADMDKAWLYGMDITFSPTYHWILNTDIGCQGNILHFSLEHDQSEYGSYTVCIKLCQLFPVLVLRVTERISERISLLH